MLDSDVCLQVPIVIGLPLDQRRGTILSLGTVLAPASGIRLTAPKRGDRVPVEIAIIPRFQSLDILARIARCACCRGLRF